MDFHDMDFHAKKLKTRENVKKTQITLNRPAKHKSLYSWASYSILLVP